MNADFQDSKQRDFKNVFSALIWKDLRPDQMQGKDRWWPGLL